MMTDWSTGTEERNYRIQRKTDPRGLRNLLVQMVCILTIAGVLVGYLWVRSRIVSLGYELQTLKKTEDALISLQMDLIAQEETLKQPQRIEDLARNQLGMEPLQPYQWLPSAVPMEGSQPGALALAGAPTTVKRGSSSANNY